MTRGAVLFAFNNDRVDYVSQAQWSAPRINRHLGLPVTLVTDIMPDDASMFDKWSYARAAVAVLGNTII